MESTERPTDEQVDKLMNAVLKEREVTLNPVQEVKFRHACIKSYMENPDVSFGDLIIAANIYLNYILRFPDLSL
ncbi:hypothetical protein GCM10009122_35000 [Fulvivirga kasyanovii]|uniref:Uncharacterized protein n=1 Tax=Fulvivirga kasyanovii TaxID=396812 RepID=A0ABW9RP92_9BACT|nr:hypothetical protein [Fulvivirga kasyanovii]MTI25511.1 hypothetical protein [Fulvivirga kasyanovii]